MRALFPTATVCLLLSPLWGTAATPQSTATAVAPAAAPAAPAATTPPPTATTSPGIAADYDAAAKHAKRTACRKNAKAKKLVGEQKTTFIKDCVAAP